MAAKPREHKTVHPRILARAQRNRLDVCVAGRLGGYGGSRMTVAFLSR